ncbi:HAD domain-containing protein [Rufibacter radiotolerans]|uniref:HAD domain-containing protein n=1 Tax=Rufibacter radiotolerans TaxID=1379910 RepID=UPI0006647B09|nr:HAD domain-containing protein [Rufibacter radiotolerans]
MKILLDIDGVLVTTPSWRPVESEADGFMKFNAFATENLKKLMEETGAEIVLTSSHRISYSEQEWRKIFERRGIYSTSVSKINQITTIGTLVSRADEIQEWVNSLIGDETYVVLDDDSSIRGLPNSILEKCVLTSSFKGLDEEATKKALMILNHTIK